jgi:SynChlorMet cassette protein ScmD
MQTKNPIANPIVVLRKEFDDWAVLFNPDTAEAVGVNPVGVAIWELLDGKNSLEDIAAQINQDFSNVPGSAAEEIQTFIEDLAKRGFVGSQLDSTV